MKKEKILKRILLTPECDLGRELFVFGTNCNKCHQDYIGELDAAALYPEFIRKCLVVKGIKRSLGIDRNSLVCKCGAKGITEFHTELLLHALLKGTLKEHIEHLKKKFKEIKGKLDYY